MIDGIAAERRVIAFDNRGVGASGGSVPHTVEEVGRDAIAFTRALGFEKVDRFGFSLGGGVAQMIALQSPGLVRRIILAGTGPRGGEGIDDITKVAVAAYVKAALTLKDSRNYLFFPRTPAGKRAAEDYLGRLEERTTRRDKRISLQARRARLKAIRAAGKSAPDDLSLITQPVFVANGDHDLMVHSSHSADMAQRLPNARLTIYPDSGHGGVFSTTRSSFPRRWLSSAPRDVEYVPRGRCTPALTRIKGSPTVGSPSPLSNAATRHILTVDDGLCVKANVGTTI